MTVTDDDGDTGTTTRQVTVAATPPPTAEIAADSFGRSVNNGWGASQTGGAWTLLGSASRYSVADGTGNLLLATPGTTAESVLRSVAARDVDLRTTLSWSRSASAGALYATLVARRQTNGSDYRVKVVTATSGAMQLVLARKVGTTETTLRAVSVPGLTMSADVAYRVAFRVVTTGGATTLSAKLWRVGTTEPAAWTTTASDSTAALQSVGSVGINTYVSSGSASGVTVRVDDLLAVDPDGA
ncbi:hypothetical protein G7085_16105 [Tessaracoccus sp. HDW20]|uniref:hypothetical protein n=1 Tax=Tessaracoccus coleopterorum TaxID=2714950 RepID=UPI0018D396BA|nr:hypothetical protein [Tessaracoccus coleopterorum]NHB85608.1 hypothetical protein [Tessaracoccus coleopterorum]